MFPIASFFPERGLLGILMKPTHPCSGPLESQACPIHRYLSLVRRRWQTGKHRMTLGWAIIVKGRWKLQVRITWMALHLNQRLLNCDVRDGVMLSWTPRIVDTGCAPPCLDASDDDAVEEDWLEYQMQESLEIDHAEATLTQFVNRTDLLHYWRSHSPSCRTHFSPSRGAACFAILEG